MPFSPAQHRLFEAAAHDPKIAKAKGIPQTQAAKMASEGIKKSPKPPVPPKALAAALMRMK